MTRESTNDGLVQSLSRGSSWSWCATFEKRMADFRERDPHRISCISCISCGKSKCSSVSKSGYLSQGCMSFLKTFSKNLFKSGYCMFSQKHLWCLGSGFFKGLNFFFGNPWKYICPVKVDLSCQNRGFNLKFNLKEKHIAQQIAWNAVFAVFWLWRWSGAWGDGRRWHWPQRLPVPLMSVV